VKQFHKHHTAVLESHLEDALRGKHCYLQRTFFPLASAFSKKDTNDVKNKKINAIHHLAGIHFYMK
jgi:hypothetical protein